MKLNLRKIAALAAVSASLGAATLVATAGDADAGRTNAGRTITATQDGRTLAGRL